LIPSKSKWKSWSLPSKYSAIGLFVGLLSLGIAVYGLYPIFSASDSLSSIKGEYELVNLGAHEINYGVIFKSKPSLKFHGGKFGGISNADKFEILEQRNDGFTFEVSGALTGGTTIIWEATGER
jgi:hypothetical protein